MKNQEILKYINLAREYPKYYVGLIDEQLNSFVDQLNIALEKDVHYETIEGKIAWEEAKIFLTNQQPLRPFDFHAGLSQAAADHAKDIIKNESKGHQGSDGSTFVQRIQRYCKKGKGSMIELLGTTHMILQKNSIELAIINLIVDDGVANRGHRRALFNKDYRYIGAEFIESDSKIFSLITMSQANLEVIKIQPISIATSTSHLKTLTQISTDTKQNYQKGTGSKENCIDYPSQSDQYYKDSQKIVNAAKNNQQSVWTLKNVMNETKTVPSKKNVLEKVAQDLQKQPSIFKQVNQSICSAQSSNKSKGDLEKQKNVQDSKQSIVSSSKITPVPIKQSSKIIKQSVLSPRSSQRSFKTDIKSKTGTSQGFGVSSEVQKFKLKSTLNTPFLKTNTFSSGFGSGINKKVVQKKQTMRSWCQDDFLVKEVTTIVKYDDGTTEDLIERHSVLKNSESYLKEQTI